MTASPDQTQLSDHTHTHTHTHETEKSKYNTLDKYITPESDYYSKMYVFNKIAKNIYNIDVSKILLGQCNPSN